MTSLKRYAGRILAYVVIFALLFGGGFSLAEFGPPGVAAQGGVTGFANLRISNFYRAQQRPILLVSMNGTLNPTGTNQVISATVGSAVATSGANITVKPRDTLLILRNVGAQTITFTETGTLVSAGNVALGALDSAMFVSDGTKWHQIAASNN